MTLFNLYRKIESQINCSGVNMLSLNRISGNKIREENTQMKEIIRKYLSK